MFEHVSNVDQTTTNIPVGPEEWLEKKVQHKHKSDDPYKINIPLRSDGSEYKIEDLKQDQKQIVFFVLKALQKWVNEREIKDPEANLLRMTIRGQAGSGKSTLINTLVTVLIKMWGYQDVVHVMAPTGGAAHGVGGHTVHKFLRAKDTEKRKSFSEVHVKFLTKKLRFALCMIFDERSLMASTLLGQAEHTTASYAHGCAHHSVSWGGIPIVIVCGDDYQLPSIKKGVYYIRFPHEHPSSTTGHYQARGELLWWETTKVVMELDASKRVREDQRAFSEFLTRL